MHRWWNIYIGIVKDLYDELDTETEDECSVLITQTQACFYYVQNHSYKPIFNVQSILIDLL